MKSSPIDQLDVPQFSSAQACEIAGIDMPTLKNWISRKQPAILLERRERKKVGDRERLRLTLRRILQIVITAELVRLGFDPREASLHAAQFTDIESAPLRGIEQHKRGELFPQGFTLLIVRHAGFADVVNAGANDSWQKVIAGGLAGDRNATALAIVNLNNVNHRVRTFLSLPLSAGSSVV
ncbi:MAG: hypothetical protein HYX37_14780 [Rhizobiales bacterium]|nr:hypothetical protein [Hyphomicrobiales bacterium]